MRYAAATYRPAPQFVTHPDPEIAALVALCAEDEVRERALRALRRHPWAEQEREFRTGLETAAFKLPDAAVQNGGRL